MTVINSNKRLSYEIPVGLRDKVRVVASQKGQTVQYYLRQVIDKAVTADLAQGN